jgi:hypothetical protein
MPFIHFDDEAVREAAIRALARFTHDDVRELAVAGAASDMRSDLVAELMERNARPGDEPLLLELSRRDLDPIIYHWMTIDLRRLLERNPAVDPRSICLELYERGPCSLCRQGIVDLLMKAGPLPDWMRDELPHDCDRRTREMAAGS